METNMTPQTLTTYLSTKTLPNDTDIIQTFLNDNHFFFDNSQNAFRHYTYPLYIEFYFIDTNTLAINPFDA